MKTRSLILTLCTPIIVSIALSCRPSNNNLTRARAEEIAAKAWREKRTRIEADYGEMWNTGVLELRNLRMPIYAAVFGAEPADGRSLFISMHGGGSAPAAVNDEQWENQKTLYQPSEGVYVAPRAAIDRYDMWSQPFLDTLFPMIIQAAMIKQNVNPNKVYVMGYSAGGDGAFRMAPRMADRWAAAAMMAGTRDEASPLNLRNIGFTMWMGQLDSAYHRNARAMEFNRILDSLQAADPDGYVHSLNIVQGFGHWMNNADTLAVDWMVRFRRNPYPDRVVWRQEQSAQSRHFYYLSIPAAEAKPGMQVRVDKNGNTLTILQNDYQTLYIDLNDKIVDLDKPVSVIRNGQQIFNGMVPRLANLINSSIEERADPDYIFSARLEVTAAGVQTTPAPIYR